MRFHQSRRAYARCCAILLLGALTAAPNILAAQFFGRNKVQYERFDFSVFVTPHFDMHYYPAESLATYDAGRMAERWYTRHSATMHHEFDRRSVIFYADPADFQQSNVISGLIGQGTGGVTEGLRERVIMPHTGIYAETDHVLGHELIHVFQYDIAATTTQSGLQSLGRVPLWMIEGMAEYLSVGRTDAHTAMWLRDAMLRDDLPTLEQLTSDPRYFPYRFGQALWAYVGGRWTDDAVEQVFRASLRLGWEDAFERVLGVQHDTLSTEWHAAIRREYEPLIAGRVAPGSIGRDVVGQSSSEGDQNISPVVSPDGRHVAFYSSRDLFGFALLVADVQTGRVIRRLTSVSTNPHYDALAFINSAGSWSPDGQRLAFIVYAEGGNEINILNVNNGNIEQRIRVPGVGALNDPAWSPNGAQLAFSGQSGGISDLYVMDMETQQTRQLTDGREAEIQPHWSPDGRGIVYATDAGSETSFEQLSYGPLRLAIMDVASGSARLLPMVGNGKHINPRYSPDGQSVYFVSDQDGFSDIYRLSLADNQFYRVTQVSTGVSGITAFSPALSVSASDGQLLFSVFNDAGFAIRALDAASAQGTPFGTPAGTVAAGSVLPPVAALETSIVRRYLESPAVGLPPESVAFEVEPYDSSLSLDYIGVPSAGVSVGGTFGSGASGAVAAYFADELNNRTVGVALQAQGTFQDIGGMLSYANRERRWNWLAAAGRTPLIGFQSAVRIVDVPVGEGQFVEGFESQLLFQRAFIDEVLGAVHYPLSTTRRVEFGLGAQRISFDNELITQTFVGNQPIDYVREDVPAPDAINLARASAAFVGDYSFFGFVSPVAGGRYRFEVTPFIGSLTYTTALADYRRYFFRRPFTLAVRGLHYGRYGQDAENTSVQQPLYLGYPSLVRGYDVNNFDGGDCTPGNNNECPEFSRLVGSRIGVASAELRIPLFGTPELGLFNLPFVPTEIAPFIDVGTAWNSGDTPDFRFDTETTDRVPVVSTGVTARVNVLGFAVVEVFYVYPFHRPDKGAHFGFQLAPGW